jgi:hypothetical protein
MLALLLSACATLQGEVESLNFPYEPGWKVGHEAEVPRQYRIIEYVRDGDDIKNWKELYTIQNFGPPWGGPSPEDALNSLKAAREKECPGITKWNVISTDGSSILYEWQAKPCLGWPDQHEIARIIYGKYNRWVLRYTVKVYQMPPEQRDKWIRDLSTAKTVTRLQ